MGKRFSTKIAFLLSLVLLVAAVFTGCGDTAQNEQSMLDRISQISNLVDDGLEPNGEPDESGTLGATEIGAGQYTFAFSAVFADGTGKEYTVHTDEEIAGEALLALGLIDGEEGQYGLYVKSVCGVIADYDIDKTYWALYTDGEMSGFGIDQVKSADVSAVEFRVEK